MAARLVEGSFQLRALSELRAEVAYAGATRYFATAKARSEARLFVVGYQDRRAIVKAAYRGAIRLVTPGAHFVSEIQAGPGSADLVLWGAAQFGRWGAQRHRASE